MTRPLTPGLMISAPASGTGKTMLMLGLLTALRRRGLTVQPFKSGPDYIDPGFHFAASGRASFNLDAWAMEPGRLIAHATGQPPADLVLAEGSMGLFDGVATKGETGIGSSAEIAQMMGWPVVLILDVSGQAQSAAATARGFATLRPDLPFAGVVLNRVASPRHDRLIREGMDQAGIRVLGSLPRQGNITLPERHLGLIQAEETAGLQADPGPCGRFHRGALRSGGDHRRRRPSRPARGACAPTADAPRRADRAGPRRGLQLRLSACAGGVAAGGGHDPALLSAGG